MKGKKTQSLNKVLFAVIALLVVVCGVLLIRSFAADTQDAGVNITVNDTPPEFSVDPAEDDGTGASSTTSPTNEGTGITFSATATDDNLDQWTLLVCKTSGVTGTDCDSGAEDRWCVSSSAVDSGASNSCSISTTGNATESNAWHAYACDSTGCGAVSQGTGDSGSPFEVNHAPVFASTTNPDGDPGEEITITATVTDSDSSGSQDNMTLYVCDSNRWSEAGGCLDSELCTVTTSGANSTASCNYTIASVKPDGDYNFWPFVMDSHSFAAGGAEQGNTEKYTTNNVAPTITDSTITLNNGSDITLQDTTKFDGLTGAFIDFTVNDNNSCLVQDTMEPEVDYALARVYRSSVSGGSSCDADDDNCYHITDCFVNEADTCGGVTDPSINWRCQVELQYHADPTTAGSQYADDKWVAAVQAGDDDSAESAMVAMASGNQVEINQTNSIAFTASISFGALNQGAPSTGQTTTMTNQGNIGLDANLKGVDLSDGGTNTIPVGRQKYHLSTLDFDWDSVGTALTTSDVEAELNCAKPKTGNLVPTKDVYWKIKVPDNQKAGSYTGTNTITSIIGEVVGW